MVCPNFSNACAINERDSKAYKYWLEIELPEFKKKDFGQNDEFSSSHRPMS
jgi:hypothetical protein